MTFLRKWIFLACLLLVAGLPLLAAAQSDTPISVGDTVTGTLTGSAPFARYTFEGSAGDQVTITLTSPDFDSYLTLLDPLGSEIAADDDSAGGKDARIAEFVLPDPGRYTIIADSYSGVSSGNYTLSLTGTVAVQTPTPIPPTAVPTSAVPTEPLIRIGDTVAGELSNNKTSAIYPFLGRAGETITINLSSEQFDVYLILQDADGNVLAEDDDSAGNFNARVEDFTLPVDGDYRIIATSYSSASLGSYTLSVESAGQAEPTATLEPTGTPTPVATTSAEGTIAYGDTVTGELTADAPEATYTFAGRAGDVVTISLTSDAIDPYLILRDAVGEQLAADDDSAGNLNARINAFTLPADGTYTIVANTYSGTGEGAFTLTLESAGQIEPPTATPEVTPVLVPTAEPSGAALRYGESATGFLTNDQLNAQYTFVGRAGDVITITVTSQDFDPFVSLRDSRGDEIASNDDSAGNLDALIADFTLPADDTYTIEIGSFSSASLGSYTLTLESAGAQIVPTEAPTVTPTAVPGETTIAVGDTVSGTIPADTLAVRYSFQGQAGQIVTITAVSDDFDPYLRLLQGGFTELVVDDDSAGALDAQIAFFTLPADDLYTIVVESYDEATGTFTLTLGEASIQPIEYGQTIRGTLTDATLTAGYRFTGRAGDVITVRMNSGEFDSFLSLYGPDGSSYPLITDDDSGGDRDALIGPYTLLSDGSYLIATSSYDRTALGSYSVQLNLAELSPIAYGYSVEAAIGGAQPALYYSFQGRAGDVVRITIDSGGALDTALTVNSPDNTQAAYDDDGGVSFDPEIDRLVLSLDGQYTILVQPYIPGTTGTVRLTLERGIERSLDESAQELRLSEKLSTDVVTFAGVAGENVRVRVQVLSDPTVAAPTVSVMQNGRTLATSDATGTSEIILAFTVPEDGPVAVQVSDYNFARVRLLVSLERD